MLLLKLKPQSNFNYYKKCLSSLTFKQTSYSNSFNDQPPSFKTIKRFKSNVSALESVVIPEIPSLPAQISDLTALGEPTLKSLGLCTWWPSGFYQSALESIHVGLDIPWWGAITLTTLFVRACIFPLILKQRRSITEFSKSMPYLVELQNRMTQARLNNDLVQMMKISNEMQDLQKSGKFSPLTTLKPILIQIPIFISVFSGLRGIANLPVDSFKTGGTLWFSDLTVCDPYYILPLLSMGSILLMIETGAEISTATITNNTRMFLRAMPVVGVFLTMNMPSALLWYWTVSNCISLVQSSVLRTEIVRKYLRLPDPKAVAPPSDGKKKEGFVKGFKTSMTNSRLMAEIENRERLDAASWEKSGKGKVPVTYSYESSGKLKKKRDVKFVEKEGKRAAS